MPGYTLSDGLTLKNKLDVASHKALEIAETRYVIQRELEIRLGQSPPRRFDAAHLKAIHRHLFQDVYEWAGRTRDERVRLSDGTIATEPSLRKIGGEPFMEGKRIAQALDKFTQNLAAENCLSGLRRSNFATCAADFMVGLNAVHPFREGNGRTQRLFLEALAENAGHVLDFSVVSRERMIQASIAGNDQDPSLMRRLFVEISDPVRVAALRKAIDAFDQHRFAWNDRYLSTSEPGHKLTLQLAGVAGDQFMARTQTTILIGRAVDLPHPRPRVSQTFTLEPTRWGDDQG